MDQELVLAITVIICSHNPKKKYLKRVLAALRGQSLPMDRWQLLLVDNRSDEPLQRSFSLDWHTDARHLREEQLGLSVARLCGIAHAQGEILVFLDDDNIVAPDFLARVCEVGVEHPWVGAWGGQISPEFESPPPGWTRPYWCFLALRDVDKDVWTNALDFEKSPSGAGMCVRRNVAIAYADRHHRNPLRQLLGRKGEQMMAGEDSDMAFTAFALGLGVGMFKRLRLTHIISADRLELAYLARLMEGIARSTVLVEFLHGKAPAGLHRSRARRVFDGYQRMRMARQDRVLYDAQERGKRDATMQLLSLSPPED